MPDEEPEHIERHVERNHELDAGHAEKLEMETHDGEQHQQLNTALHDDVAHVYVGFSTADDEIVIERRYRQKGTAYAESLQIARTAEPLVGEQEGDELRCHSEQEKHQRERYERRETQHLSECLTQALRIASHLYECRLCHSLNNAGDELASHGVPLVGLGVRTDFARFVRIAEHECEDVVVDTVEYIGHQHLAAESEHFAHRLEGESQGRTPSREMPCGNGAHCDEHDALRGNTPIGHAAEGHGQTDKA